MLGRPIGHSLSPALHRAAYRALDLDWTYDAVDVGAGELAGFLDGCGPDWAGLSLTMPLKVAVLPLLDEVGDLASVVGAVNTVLLTGGRRVGTNTDVPGMLAALHEAGLDGAQQAVVLGAGATARSALAALAELGAQRVRLVARSLPDATRELADRLATPVELRVVDRVDPAQLAGVDLLVSTLPAGVADELAPHVGDVAALLDVVYAPWPTPLAAGCRGTVVSGLAMLLHQAAEQVRLMTGRPAPLDAMRAALPALKG